MTVRGAPPDGRLDAGMPYLTVITLAAAVGGAVAAFTLYQGRPRPNEASRGSPAHARALPSSPTAQTRLIGALGLMVAVLAGAGAIAVLCYLAYAAVKHAVG
ncbi:MAG TPA: hypothetical protein VJ736_11610 [Actinomycetota bacterium]|nr:hypothetical protein [Actinomycetota bacterium]